MHSRYIAVFCLATLALGGCQRHPSDEATSSTSSAPGELSSSQQDHTASGPAMQSAPQ